MQQKSLLCDIVTILELTPDCCCTPFSAHYRTYFGLTCRIFHHSFQKIFCHCTNVLVRSHLFQQVDLGYHWHYRQLSLAMPSTQACQHLQHIRQRGLGDTRLPFWCIKCRPMDIYIYMYKRQYYVYCMRICLAQSTYYCISGSIPYIYLIGSITKMMVPPLNRAIFMVSAMCNYAQLYILEREAGHLHQS